jgi:hypothetical protein
MVGFLRGRGLRRFLSLRGWLSPFSPKSVLKPLTDWERRRRFLYLHQVFALASFIGRDARSIVDVGSNGHAYLDWFDWIPRRVSIDLETPYCSPNVISIRSDFLTADIRERFDLCLCLQTIEHVPDAERFSRRLLSIATHVLVSVPYRWPAGRDKDHVHDPVDEEKVAGWFGRAPDFQMISTEPNGTRRLICYFNCDATQLNRQDS